MKRLSVQPAGMSAFNFFEQFSADFIAKTNSVDPRSLLEMFSSPGIRRFKGDC